MSQREWLRSILQDRKMWCFLQDITKLILHNWDLMHKTVQFLGSACSSTVCGENWPDNFINSLDKRDRIKVQQSIGQKIFKFGGETRLKPQGEYSIPAVIAGKEVTIKTDVVGSDIPLLLSRSAMKTAGVKMDLEKGFATIYGLDIALNLTSLGHYCIPIDRSEKIPIKEMNTDERYKTLL